MIEQLLKYMDEQLPYEAVAFLLGKKDRDRFKAEEVVKVKNASLSSVKFTVEPEELLSVYKRAERLGLEIVCIFHTHPGPATPSKEDEVFMKLNPVPWLIASSLTRDLRAFIIDDKISEIEIDTI
jgi:proteasome lid subunit RPN8/RPN11